ncbi:MAG: DUF2007 domain-containing protein [Acidobacteriota bacterium]
MADPEDPNEPNYVTLFETSEVDVVPVIKSLLDSAQIPYVLQGGEAMMNLFPSDMLGNLMGQPGREIRFQVLAEDLEAAKELLEAEPVETPELRPDDED